MRAPVSIETASTRTLDHPLLGDITAWLVGNRVGESPVWHRQEAALYWIDVRAPQLLRLDPLTRELRRWQLPGVVGAMALCGTHHAWLALQHSVVQMDLHTGLLEEVASVPNPVATNRLNDGKVSPGGRWFVFGSMDDRVDKKPTGALHVLAHDGQVRQLFDGLVVANGIAWNGDGSAIYFSDSARGLLLKAAWDENSGTMGRPLLLATLDEAQGRPDGACVDAADGYWSAGVSAGVLHCIDPNGLIRQRVALPVRAPTMCAFGGPDAGQMFVTSLVRPQWDSPGPLEGSVLQFAAPVQGRLQADLLAQVRVM
jgi:sugar lactone lactonase YvrE